MPPKNAAGTDANNLGDWRHGLDALDRVIAEQATARPQSCRASAPKLRKKAESNAAVFFQPRESH
eukprot:2549500-Prymnesium_polylepis.1